LVQMSSCQQPPTTPLCKSSCDTYISTMSANFQNSTICPTDNKDAVKFRQLAVNEGGYKPFCDGLTADKKPGDNSTVCSLGVTAEINHCGFFDPAEGLKWCADAANAKDPCCATVTTEVLTTASDSLLNANSNIWIITGVAIGVLVILVIGFILYIRARKWNQQTTKAVQPKSKDIESDSTNEGSKINRFTKRLSKNLGALFKSRRATNAEKMKSILSPSPFKGPKAAKAPKGDWEKSEPLPPMPNVTLIRKKTGGVPKNEIAVPTNGNIGSSYLTPAPVSVISPVAYGNDGSTRGNNMVEMPQSMMQQNDTRQTQLSIATLNAPTAATQSYIPTPSFTLLVAVEEFFPTLDDEIQLQVGDKVQVVEQYDDGWCIGKNLTSGEIGAFPGACLSEEGKSTEGRRRSEYRSRTNSLYAPGPRK
ncbi:hypothetical protein HK098_006307, partial [Nowakowskiella sp. JEL0407]